MQALFPAIEAHRHGTFAVGDEHCLYWEESGHPAGIPVLFLHGGPGSGCEPWHRRFFDPQRYRILLFDQRGAGRSTPHASLTDNTTWHLVADIERLREFFGVHHWVIFGGSWGSTLALAYAETHPERVLGLILRGIFLCRRQDVQWFYQSGADRIFPEAWSDFLAPIPPAEHGDLLTAYHRRLTDPDLAVRSAAAHAWSVWEGRCSCLYPSPQVQAHFAHSAVSISLARIEAHYFMHDCFMEEDQLLRDAGRLVDIPGVIVHGRYDIVCPVQQATALHAVWPSAQLNIIADAGHSAAEPGNTRALVAATEAFADRFSQKSGLFAG